MHLAIFKATLLEFSVLFMFLH